MYYKVRGYFEKNEDRELTRDYKAGKISSLIIPAILTVIVIYFTSGYFKYQAVAIASGSMSPKIEKGDIVIIEKLEDTDFSNLKKGDIIAFQHRSVVVVHRIIDIKKVKEELYFYTKGDANDTADNYSITKEEIVGKVDFWIPFMGLPTVWLNEM
jgi:signal peptidase I